MGRNEIMNFFFELVSLLIFCLVEEIEERSILNNVEKKNYFYRWKVFEIKVILIKFKII